MGLRIHPTNMVEAEATMTTSADKVTTWVSRATSGETAVRVFILLQTFSFFCSCGSLKLPLKDRFYCFSVCIAECHEVTHATSLSTATWMHQMIWTSFRRFTFYFLALYQYCVLPAFFGVMRLFLFLKGLFCNYCATRTAVNRFINKVVIKLQ